MLLTILLILPALLYLALAIGRLFSSRINSRYKTTSFIRTLLVLLVYVAFIGFIESLYSWFDLSVNRAICLLVLIQSIVLLIIYGSYLKYKNLSKVDLSQGTETKLPSVSICIPARNETQDLKECLDSIIASNYEKLEILVYDDSSQPKHTNEIKKLYANSGVKYVNGSLPESKWLAKNYAYERLLEESNGEIVIFAGVDTRFSINTVDNIVKVLTSGVAMISILPENQIPDSKGFAKYLIQPVRYAWEIGLPRWLVNRPPVLSTCWAIYRKNIESQGGFSAVSRKVVPESYFARQCLTHNLKYQFIISNKDLELKNIKLLEEQKSTAIRTRYPQLHRRIENVMFTSLALFFIFISPFIFTIYGFVTVNFTYAFISLFNVFISSFIYGKFVTLTYRKNIPISYLLSPMAALYDLFIVNYSMWQYEFGTVLWKGRNISQPVIDRESRHKHLL